MENTLSVVERSLKFVSHSLLFVCLSLLECYELVLGSFHIHFLFGSLCQA